MDATRSDTLAQVMDQLSALFDAGDKKRLLEEIARLLGSAQREVNSLSGRVAELLTQLYGRKSERFNPNQLEMALAALQPVENPDEPAITVPPSEGEPRSRQRASRSKKRGRKSLPSELPREEIVLLPNSDQLAEAGDGMKKIGEQRSEVLEWVPAHFKVLVYIRETWANDLGEIVTAPPAPKVIDKGLPGPGLLAQVAVAKFRDHLPLNRQVQIYRRSGVELSRSTLVDWMAAVAYLLEPLARLIFQRVMSSHVLQVDDTRLPVLDRKKKKNIKNGRLWAMVGDTSYVAYRYTRDWKGASAAEFLALRIGWMQVDGYKGYKQTFQLGLAIEVGCWMHCRRYFYKALERGDKRAQAPLAFIRGMYQVEAASKEAGDSPQERLERRLRDSVPLRDQLGQWIADHGNRELPSSHLGKALTYAINQWNALMRPFEDGALELDNGEVERALRGPAQGRKNWLFAGSDAGAERSATIATVLESAVRHGVEPWAYLQDVLTKLSHGWLNRRLEELLPHRWRELHDPSRTLGDTG